HPSQISTRQSNPAFSVPIDPTYIGGTPKKGGTSQQAKSHPTQSVFRVARERNQQQSAKSFGELGETMPANKYSSRTVSVICLLLLATVGPLAAATASELERLEKLGRAVEQLQKRNAELEAEVSNLKGGQSAVVPEGKMKTKIISEGKTYVEKVVEEKLPVYVQQRGPELKLVLGGFIQLNFEDGDVSAFEGRFGQTAIK